MRLIGWTIDNFMIIEAAEIRPDGAMTVIAGPNEGGKSTAINAVWHALGVSEKQPEKPIRDGAEEACITVNIGEADGPKLTVTRIYKDGRPSTLSVTEKRDGRDVVFRSPQRMLSAMLNALTFDPEAFGRMKPKEQAELLARVVGLDTAEIDARIEALESERLHAGRDLRNFGDAPKPAGGRPEGVDVAVLVELLREGEAHNRAGRDESMRRIRERERINGRMQRVASLRLEAKDLREQAARADAAAGEIEAEARQESAALDAQSALPDPFNPEPVEREIAAAESRNAAVRAYDQALERHEHRQALVKQHEADEAALKAARDERAEMVASIAMPVDGLAIVDGAVRYGEHPFSQAAESKRLEIGVAIGAAQDPTLRLMRVEHGSLLDSKALAHLGELAEKYDMQVLVEKVADADTGCGLYIENGRIAERDT